MFLCVDCGLTNTKVMLFSHAGVCIAGTSFSTPLNGICVDTQELRFGLIACIKEILMSHPDTEVNMVVVSGHGNGLYAIGNTDVFPLGWSSMVIESAPVLPKPTDVFALTAQTSWPGQPLAILAWLKQTKPDIYKGIQKIMFCKDLLRWFMTGVATTEPTDASAAGLLNAETGNFDPALLALYGLEDAWDKLPALLPSDAVAGYVSEDFSQNTGLPMGTPVLGGLFDVNSCMLGAGITDSNCISLIAGTWGINAVTSPILARSNTITQCCRFYGMEPYVCIDSAPTSCSNLEWFAKNIMESTDFAQLSEIVRTQPADPELLYLPFLYAPMDLPSVQSGFIGLRPHHTKADMLRAVFEGIVFEHRRRLKKLETLGFVKKGVPIVLSGGAANSPVFGQLFADVFGREVRIPIQTQAGAMGGVLLCCCALGLYNSPAEAIHALVRYGAIYTPNKQVELCLIEKYHRFVSLCSS